MNYLMRATIISIVGAAVLLLTACGEKRTNNVPSYTGYSYTTKYETIVTTSPSSTTYTATVSPDSSALVQDHPEITGSFRSAVWLAKDSETENERFLLFTDDTHGKIIDQQDGKETPFTYTLSGETPSFTIGAEGAKPVTVYFSDDTHAVIQWGQEKTEALTCIRENSSEPLHFYHNEQLCAMALAYYEQTMGTRPAHARVFYNYDETIAVQLYNGDGNASDTLDWYTVDRFTAEGYNTLNQTISLTGVPAGAAPAQTTGAASTTTAVTTAQQTTAATTTVPPMSTVAQTIPAQETVPPTEAPSEPMEEIPAETNDGWEW